MIPSSILITIPHFGSGTSEKINAIKAIRGLTGMGLKEAKDLSELPGAHTLRLNVQAAWDPSREYETVKQENYKQYKEALKEARVRVCENTELESLLDGLRNLASTAVLKGQNDLAFKLVSVLREYA